MMPKQPDGVSRISKTPFSQEGHSPVKSLRNLGNNPSFCGFSPTTKHGEQHLGSIYSSEKEISRSHNFRDIPQIFKNFDIWSAKLFKTKIR